jgi:enoyl-CoA hydratase/carnithine racemase
VNRVVEPSGLRAATEGLVGEILKCGPQAIRLQKELIIRWRNSDLRTAISAGVEAFALAFASDEPRMAMEAFLEKRPATFD